MCRVSTSTGVPCDKEPPKYIEDVPEPTSTPEPTTTQEPTTAPAPITIPLTTTPEKGYYFSLAAP